MQATSDSTYGVRDWRTFAAPQRSARPARVRPGPVRRRYASPEWAMFASVLAVLPTVSVTKTAPERGSRESWECDIVAFADTEASKPIMTARDLRVDQPNGFTGATNRWSTDSAGIEMRATVDAAYVADHGAKRARDGEAKILLSRKSRPAPVAPTVDETATLLASLIANLPK